MRGALDAERMPAPGGAGPARFQAWVGDVIAGQGKLQLALCLSRMRPNGRRIVWRLHLFADKVKEPQAGRIEPGGDGRNIVHIPGDGVEVLPETVVKSFHRRIPEVLHAGGHHRLHDDIPDGNQGGITTGQLFIAVIEARDREHVVIPGVNGFEVVHNMGEMKQLAYFEHGASFQPQREFRALTRPANGANPLGQRASSFSISVLSAISAYISLGLS